jgi:ABC-2 type transport system ATP-binding protein
LLVASKLRRQYDQFVAVHDVSLEVRPGKIVGLVGNNGAGKTTTIKMLVGLLDPTEGTAHVDGEATRVPATRRFLGYLPEESPLYDDMHALDYLRFFASLYNVPRREAHERAEALLARLGLAKNAWKKPIGTLSKGMRRKIAIARCLLHDPPILVLDEPTSGLDPGTARELDDFLRELRGQGKAIMLSAHNLSQVEQLCDEILVMHDGRIVARGTLQDLRAGFGPPKYRLTATMPFSGSTPDGAIHRALLERLSDVESTLRQIKEAGGIVLEVESVFASLEEIMRKVTTQPREGHA